VQTFPGPDLAGGGPILYGMVRASTRAPIQSGPLRFARCLGRKGTWSSLGAVWRARATPVLANGRRPSGLSPRARAADYSLQGARGQLVNIRAVNIRARARGPLPSFGYGGGAPIHIDTDVRVSVYIHMG
jgi:hypothetical protein